MSNFSPDEVESAQRSHDAADVQLRKDDALLSSILNSALSGIMAFKACRNAQGGIIDFVWQMVNAAAESMVGLTQAELLGKQLLEVMPGNKADGLFDRYVQVVETGIPLNHEHYYEHEKVKTWFHTVAVKLDDGFVVTFSNITDRKRAEAALQESEERYRALVHHMQVGVVVHRPDTSVQLANPMATQLLGLTADQMRGKTAIDPAWCFVREDGTRMPLTDYPVNRALATDEPLTNLILGIIRPDRALPTWVQCDTHSIRNQDGQLQQVVVTFVDITERHQAEEALRDSNELLALFIKHSPIYAFIKDVSPTESRVRIASDNFQDMVGIPGSAMAGKTMAELFPADFAAIMTADDWAVASSGDVLRLDEDLHDRNYTTIKYPISMGGKNLLAGYTIDITDRKQAESERERLQAQLSQAQKMESIGQLAGGIAHDFNNMLAVILGHTELALLKVDPALPLHEELREIQRAAERSADLTRQLLAFARKQTVAPQVLVLNDTVAGMLKMLRRLIGEEIDLVWQPAAGLWPINIDPAQIDQILANLCVNARDAIAGVGKITIETQNRLFDADDCAHRAELRPGAYALLAVSDNGRGMDAETQAHLFEPFFTTKGVGKGTGLGLAMVYGIVKQNHGFINVYSEPGHGTTFKIYLPRFIRDTARAELPLSVVPSIRGQETVLLVEDEPAILKLGICMLEQQGYRVLAAITPSEALRIAEEHAGEIHLVLTDVVMPEMNGRELAQRLLARYPKLKQLFMSGYTANVIAHHGVLDEGVNFLQKPFTLQELARKVRAVLDA
jgi:PAS domain S-box-containing protein